MFTVFFGGFTVVVYLNNIYFIVPSSLIAISNSGSFRAVLKEVTRNSETRQYIEIWDATTKLDCLDLESAGVHGKVHTTGSFASFQWGHIENKLLYIAERKPAKKVRVTYMHII